MAKSKEQRFKEYRANRDHDVGSEAGLTEEEIARKRKLEAKLKPPINPYKNVRG